MKNALFAEIRRAMNLLWIPAVLEWGFLSALIPGTIFCEASLQG